MKIRSYSVDFQVLMRPLRPVGLVSSRTGVLAGNYRLRIRLPALRSAVHIGFLLLSSAACAAPIPVCEGGSRAARHLTCIVDGDTGWQAGRKWRYKAIDAPELAQHAACEREAELAIMARERLRQLMADGYRIDWTGTAGRYGRALVTITLNDGRDAGAVLVREHLAQPWPNRGNVWCSQ